MSFGLAATVLLLFGQLRSSYALIAGGIAVIVMSIIVLRHYRLTAQETASRERFIWNCLVLAGAALWGIFNNHFVAQHVITDRDPGVYANAGAWLIHHTSLQLPLTNVFSGVANVLATSPGFSTAAVHGQTMVFAQGLHLLPIFLGLTGRVFGLAAMFRVNVWFGVMALLAVYSVARALVKPIWAATIAGALAASMPFIYFSRDTYSEPLAATFTFAALSLLCLALKTRRPGVWLLAGLMAGAGTLTRVDGFLVISGFEAFLVLHLILSKSASRRADLVRTGLMAFGMTVSGVIGWLDLSRLSTPYYLSTRTQFLEEFYLIIAVLTLGAAAICLAWRTQLLRRLDTWSRPWRSTGVVLALLLAVIGLASRPLWLRAHGSNGLRSYAELSTEWISWYLGPLVALLGVAGLAVGAARIVKRYDPLLTATFFVFAGTAIVYLLNPNISPDQIWASRRLVPVILPGVGIFAAIALDELGQHYFRRIRWRELYFLLAALTLLLGPLITSRPLLLEHDTNLLAPLESVCQSLPSNAAVIWIGYAEPHFLTATKTMCNIPAEGYGLYYMDAVPSQAVLAQLAQQARSSGHQAVIGLYGTDASLLGSAQDNLTTVSAFSYTKLKTPVVHAPDAITIIHNSLLLGLIQPNGTLAPLKP